MKETITNIHNWRQFSKLVRSSNQKMLKVLPKQKKSIFVAGCQRSGTTILTHALLQSPEIADYRTNLSNELEGALILSGRLSPLSEKLIACYQTTYLNESYNEYLEHIGSFKLIYIIRNPYSVIYSMLYHWKRRREIYCYALNELFDNVGKDGLSNKEKKWYKWFGSMGFSRLHKACLSYREKTGQLFKIYPHMKKDTMVIDYDDLVNHREIILPKIYSFLSIEYTQCYDRLINSNSTNKYKKLTAHEREEIHKNCWSVYQGARKLTGDIKDRISEK